MYIYDLQEPIIDSNVIGEVIKTSLEISSKDNALKLISLIKASNREVVCCVQTGKPVTIFPAYATVDIVTRVRAGPMREATNALFEPNYDDALPDELEIEHYLLTLSLGTLAGSRYQSIIILIS